MLRHQHGPNAGTFANNPQFRIRLTDRDPDDDDNLCTVVIAVMQKYRREQRANGVDNLAIGFAVYEVGSAELNAIIPMFNIQTNGQTGRLGTDFFANTKSVGRSPAFINLREVGSSNNSSLSSCH